MNEIQNSCEEFSKGNFTAVFHAFADDIQWNIIGDKILKGKKDVTDFCTKMQGEMEGSQLNNINMLHSGAHSVIEGCCNYINTDNQPALVEYCDIYNFEQGKIKSITSYCITSAVKPVTV